RMALSAGFGGLATITPQLKFGAHIAHVNQPLIDDISGERIPARMAAGIAWSTDKLFVTAELEKELRYPTTVKAGFEYMVYNKLAFRTGFNIDPDAGFLGLGFKTSRFT